MPVATRLIAPLLVQTQAKSIDASGPANETATSTVPDFIPGDHDLTFKNASAPPEAASASAPPDLKAIDKPGAPGAIALPADKTTVTAAVSPSVEPDSGLREMPAPASVPAAAAIDPMSAEEGTKPIQTVTIEPDPTLPQSGSLQQGPGVPRRPLIAAKTLFGAAKGPAPLAPRSIGTYARGCLAGGVALPIDGPAWQEMRLSRNRNWGHPTLIKLVEKLALDAQKNDGWPGLLVGDISQPRGGPMLSGHASHQIGLDADVWLTPMPNRTLSRKEREEINATSMLDATDVAVDKKIFTDAQVKLIKRAASYPEVERVLVHPAIKKALCEAAGTDRKWLDKVRPIAGHYYHFHIRIGCPSGSVSCAPQKPPPGDDGCGKEVQEWLARVTPSKLPPAPRPPGYKPPPPAPPITLASMPQECSAVLETGPGGVAIPADAKMDLKAIANAPAALRPHLRKLSAAAGK